MPEEQSVYGAGFEGERQFSPIVDDVRSAVRTELKDQLQSHLQEVQQLLKRNPKATPNPRRPLAVGESWDNPKATPRTEAGRSETLPSTEVPRWVPANAGPIAKVGRSKTPESTSSGRSAPATREEESGSIPPPLPPMRQASPGIMARLATPLSDAFGITNMASMSKQPKRIFGSHVLHDMTMKSSTGLGSHELNRTSVERFRQATNKVASSHAFDSFSVLMILINSIVIGIETDHISRYKTSTPVLKNMQIAFNVWYILEVCLKVFSERHLFVMGKEWRWNAFDTVMVIISVADLVIDHNLQISRTVRVIRMIRIMRTMRILRSLRYLREFRKMVFALTASVPTLFWSLVLLLGVMYTFAVWFTQAVSNHQLDVLKLGIDDAGLGDLLEEHYGDLPMSIYTLYKSVTSGMSWGEAATPLFRIHWVYHAFFLVFISLTVFGVLNIIMSVFVDSAMQATQNSRELMLEEKMRTKEMYVNHLKSLFNDIDADGSGILSEDELERFLRDTETVGAYFEALEIDASDASRLFKLLDADESGEVDIMEFCDGCLQVKGEASSFDVNCIIYEHRRMQKWLAKFMSHVEDELRNLLSENRQLSKAVSRISMQPESPQNTRHEAASCGQTLVSEAVRVESPDVPELGSPAVTEEDAPIWAKHRLRVKVSDDEVSATSVSRGPGGNGTPSVFLETRIVSCNGDNGLSGEGAPAVPQTRKPNLQADEPIPVSL